MGADISQGQKIGEIEGKKSVEDVYTPVTGRISEVNLKLFQDPKLLNTYADTEWMVKTDVENPEELEDLTTKEKYDIFIKEIKEDLHWSTFPL